MRWGWIWKTPKWALIIVLIVGSTIAFGAWWFIHSAKKAFFDGLNRPGEDIGPKIALVEAKKDRLLLIDNDLYDLDTGALIFKSWLKKGMPGRLFYSAETKKFIGQYEKGFVRYGPSGEADAMLLEKFKPAFSDDLKWAAFARSKDIWRADVDWKEFKFVNERKVTAIEQFNETYFADSIFLGTDKTVVVRNANKLLRVSLETGDVKPVQISLNGIAKRKSLDGKYAVSLERGQFHCYDVDADDSKTVQVGRGVFNDYQWLDNDRCAMIAAGKGVVLYERLKNTLEDVVALPGHCDRIGEVSPTGRFAFCVGRPGVVLVDFEKKTAVPITVGDGVFWLNNETIAFSREVPDSELRGMWLQTVGEGERRISPEPYLVGRSGPMVKTLKSAGLVLFATKHGISTMKADGTGISDLIKLASPPIEAVGIEEWKTN